MSNAIQSLRGSFPYQPHLALYLELDAEWTRRRSREFGRAHLDVFRKLRQLSFNLANTVDGDLSGLLSKTLSGDERLGSHLYNPICYVPWSHADCSAIVLLDDFAPVHSIPSELDTTIEDLSLAFCPDLKLCNESDVLVDLAMLPNPRRIGNESCWKDLSHDFQIDMPFLVFTRYKMDGLATVGFAMMFQEALYAAMQSHVRNTIDTLIAASDQTTENMNRVFSDLADLTNFRCAFVDLQGSEEVGSFMFCRNYSVAMTLVATLRCLQYRHLFNAGDRGADLRDALDASQAYNRLQQIAVGGNQPFSETIRSNHVFRWTMTSCAAAPHVFGQTRHGLGNCSGYVSPIMEFQVPPGHQGTFLKRLSEKLDKRPVENLHSSSMLFEIGRCDYLAPIPRPERRPLVPIADLIETVTEIQEEFGGLDAPDQGRHVIDVHSLLSVPVPENIPGLPSELQPKVEVASEHTAPLSVALRELQDRLCHSKEALGDETRRGLGPKPGRLSVDKIQKLPKLYEMPMTLHRNVECLFQEFHIHVADYFSFDNVIDLYDAFAAFHSTLTEHLPEALIPHADSNGTF